MCADARAHLAAVELGAAARHAAWLQAQLVRAGARGGASAGAQRRGHANSEGGRAPVARTAPRSDQPAPTHSTAAARLHPPTLAGSPLVGGDLAWRDAVATTAGAAALGLLQRARHAAFSLDMLEADYAPPPPGPAAATSSGCTATSGSGCGAREPLPAPLGALLVYGGVKGTAWLADLAVVRLWERHGSGGGVAGGGGASGTLQLGALGGGRGVAGACIELDVQEVVQVVEGEQRADCCDDAGGADSVGRASSHASSSSAASAPPRPHAAVMGPGQRRDFAACAVGGAAFVVHGGFDGKCEASDLWRCDLQRQPLRGSGGAPDAAAAAAAAAAESTADGAWQAVWRRVQVPAGCAAPPARSHHSLVWSPGARCAVAFGGYRSGAGCLNDLWVWSSEDEAWWHPDATGAAGTEC